MKKIILYILLFIPFLSSKAAFESHLTWKSDVEKISEQYKKLTKAFKGHNTKFFYACKALTNVNILKHLLKLGASLDCVSINEVMLGLKAGFKASDILFTPNCVSIEEIKMGELSLCEKKEADISTSEKFIFCRVALSPLSL